jgi:hypothetical protein
VPAEEKLFVITNAIKRGHREVIGSSVGKIQSFQTGKSWTEELLANHVKQTGNRQVAQEVPADPGALADREEREDHEHVS